MTDNLRLFLVAGEPSGDRLGGDLIAALKAASPGATFAGVGGARMAGAGLTSLFPIAELAVMGLVEVLPHIRRILQRMEETVAAAAAFRPDVVVTIDAPGFSLRLAKRLRARLGADAPMVHYVAPTVWAWKAHRAAKMAAIYDEVLCLLPFEPPWFEREGLAARFVGHPAIDDRVERAAARAALDIPETGATLCVMPGSRRSEIGRLGSVFRATVDQMTRKPARALFPTVETVAETVGALAGDWPTPAALQTTPEERQRAMAAADAALAASGTAGLELAALGTPHLVAYRLSPLTFAIARRMVKTRFVHLVNILADRPLIGEFLQEECRPDRLAPAMDALMTREAWPADAIAEQLARLRPESGAKPADAAAQAVLARAAR